MNKDTPILAAGGIVWKRRQDELQLALVHRPKYDDWSLPKGKYDSAQDESLFATAIREVREETGFRVTPEFYVGELDYSAKGKNKTVKFWNMVYFDTVGMPAPGEIDGVEWMTYERAKAKLSYNMERQTLDKAFEIQERKYIPPFSIIAAFSYRASTSAPLKLHREEKVAVERRPSEWPGWVWIITLDGRAGWTPESLLKIDDNRGLATADYDATELTFEKGDHLTAMREESGWVWCRDKINREGWAPLAYLTPYE